MTASLEPIKMEPQFGLTPGAPIQAPEKSAREYENTMKAHASDATADGLTQASRVRSAKYSPSY
jgi:hypothetical protein